MQLNLLELTIAPRAQTHVSQAQGQIQDVIKVVPK